jgi:hypothetical protein
MKGHASRKAKKGVKAHNDIQVPVHSLRANVPYPPFLRTHVCHFISMIPLTIESCQVSLTRRSVREIQV